MNMQTNTTLTNSHAIGGIQVPSCVRGMKVLDREQFKQTVQVATIAIPCESINHLSKAINKKFIKRPGIRPLAEPADKSSNTKIVIFDPELVTSLESFSEEENRLLRNHKVDMSTFKICDIELTYENYTYKEILGGILPENSDGVAGFSTIGHIIHLNLREDVLDYKKIIGQVLLDKIKTAHTIVNKTNIIDNTYRNFEMELVAGKPDMVTTAKENGFTFKMDFSKVYWNPRLGTEHQKIIDQLKKGDVVYDMFAGIGPFAVPAARKCFVYANDLNPESYHWLKHNLSLKENKVKENYETFNLDGRDFIRNVVKSDMMKRAMSDDYLENYNMHIVMNLPALAIEFLDVFVGLLKDVKREDLKSWSDPMVHCHCFSKADDLILDVKQRVEAVIQRSLPDGHEIRIVRNVAPGKEMLCAEFRLEKDLLFCQASEEPLRKRFKEDNTDS